MTASKTVEFPVHHIKRINGVEVKITATGMRDFWNGSFTSWHPDPFGKYFGHQPPKRLTEQERTHS